MKKTCNILFLIIIAIVSVYCVGQELVKPKTKKSYVSEQQEIELDGDMVVCGTQAAGILIDFSRAVFLVTQKAVTRVNEYACGEKDCLNKVERTQRYEKKVKIKEKIEKCIEQLQEMLRVLNELIDSLEA